MRIRATDIELRVLFERIVQTLQVLGWNTVILVLRDGTSQTICPVAVTTADPALEAVVRDASPVPFHREAWRKDQFRISRSYLVDYRTLGEDQSLAGQGIVPVDLEPRAADEWQAGEFLIVPLIIDGEELGWLSITDPANPQRSVQAQVYILEGVADQVALAIGQARLAQQVNAEAMRQRVLNEIAQTISHHLEIADLVSALTQQLRQVFLLQRVSVTLREGDRPHARIFACEGDPTIRDQTQAATPLEDLAFAWIIQQNQPRRIVDDLADVQELDDEVRLLETGFRSYVCLPLRMWGQVIGALSLAADTPQVFLPGEADFLAQLADHVAAAVWNALLHEVEQKRRHIADALARLSKLINSTLDLDQVLELALEQLARVIDFDTSSILLANGLDLTITACRGFDNPESLVGAVFRLEENNISHQTMRMKEVRVVADVQQLPEWGHDRDDIEGAHTIRAWMGAPLVVRDESIGLLVMDKFVPDFFTEEDAEIVAAFADQIAIAIHNARLYESELRKRQTADAMARLAQIVNSTLELDEVLELALQQLEQVVTYDSASIMFMEGANLVVAACQGFACMEDLLGNVVAPDDINLSYGVLRDQQKRVVADVKQEPGWGVRSEQFPEMLAIRSWIGVPLLVRGQGIGVMTVDKHEPDFYSDEDGEMAHAFAAQISTAIQNARLYQATEEQRDRLSAILNDITDVMIVLDINGHVWLLNPAAEHRLGVQREHVFGEPVTALNLPDLNAALAEVQQTDAPSMSEIAGPEGTSFHASIAPVRDVGWVIVMQDITPLKELDQLRTEWVATVSHDLKNPVQIIQLGAALLEMDGPLNELQLERVNVIQRGAEQIRSLVTGVLDLARLEAGPTLRLAAINPGEMVAAALAEIDHLAVRQGQQIVSDMPALLPLIMGDGMLLQRAVVNLLSNAIKYTPADGTITLRIQPTEYDLQIDVIDTGQGIPAEALPLLFDRFYRVPGTQAEGTGLGLSIVKSIVEKHKGTIEVDSALGEGSTFTIRLPLAEVAAD
jgi:PAS domain S-box-containing protein